MRAALIASVGANIALLYAFWILSNAGISYIRDAERDWRTLQAVASQVPVQVGQLVFRLNAERELRQGYYKECLRLHENKVRCRRWIGP
jgi:hypothetical protein